MKRLALLLAIVFCAILPALAQVPEDTGGGDVIVVDPPPDLGDVLTPYLGGLAGSTLAAWAIVQVFGKRLTDDLRQVIALGICVSSSMVLHGAQIVPAPGTPPWDWAVAAFGGAAAGAFAGHWNDRVANPVRNVITGRVNGQ